MKAKVDSINVFSAMPMALMQFYCDVFGLLANDERSHAPDFYLLEGEGGCNVLLQQAELVGGQVGYEGFELGFALNSIEGLGERVVAAGGSIVNDSQQMGWGKAITVADPEGHRINAYVFEGPTE